MPGYSKQVAQGGGPWFRNLTGLGRPVPSQLVRGGFPEGRSALSSVSLRTEPSVQSFSKLSLTRRRWGSWPDAAGRPNLDIS